LGLLRAGMVIGCPVCGFRPSRAARSLIRNVPKPVIVTSSPEDSADSIASNVALTTFETWLSGWSTSFATALTRSLFRMYFPLLIMWPEATDGLLRGHYSTHLRTIKP